MPMHQGMVSQDSHLPCSFQHGSWLFSLGIYNDCLVFTDELFEHVFDVILAGNRPVRAVVGRAQPDIPAADAKFILAAGDFLEKVGSRLAVNLLSDGEQRALLSFDVEQGGEILDAGLVRFDNPVREPAFALRLHEQLAIPLEPHQELYNGVR